MSHDTGNSSCVLITTWFPAATSAFSRRSDNSRGSTASTTVGGRAGSEDGEGEAGIGTRMAESHADVVVNVDDCGGQGRLR